MVFYLTLLTTGLFVGFRLVAMLG